MKTELYIEGNLVELDESVKFAITKEFDDLSNPTNIINDWTKEVAIPFTNRNHILFGHLYNVNKRYISSGVGVNFNPHTKFNFQLIYNGILIMSGYMKMNSITREGGKGHYNITLNGMLGKILSDLKNIGFKNSEYPIDEKKYVDTYINKELVLLSFENIPNTSLTEDGAIRSNWIDGQYYNVVRYIAMLTSNPEMQMTKTPIKPYTDYIIKGILPASTPFYAVILFKNNIPMKFLDYIDGESKEYQFNSEDFDSMVVQSRMTFKPIIIIRKNQPYSIIGFTPTNSGYYPNFDSTTFCKTDIRGNSIKFVSIEDELNNSNYPTAKYTAESAVGDGLLPRQLGECRSYYQQPYIYFNKLFQMFAAKAKEVTGYEFDLDADWFNEDNPYWSRLCMLLNPLNTEESNNGIHNDYYILTKAENTARHFWNPEDCKQTKLYSLYSHTSNELNPIYSDGKWYLKYDEILKLSAHTINSRIFVDKLTTENEDNYLRLNGLAFFKNRLIFKNSLGEVVYTKKFAITSDQYASEGTDGYTFSNEYKEQQYQSLISDGYSVYLAPEKGEIDGDYKVFTSIIPLNQEISAFQYSDYFTMEIESEWTENFVVLQNEDEYDYPIYWEVGYNNWDITYINAKRSFASFTISDLWDENTSVYDSILNYTKIFGLLWSVDEVDKKIFLTRRVNFFKDYSIVDWSDKIDYSKQFIISPIITDYKYVEFNYADLDTDINNAYNKEFDVNYGELRLDTAYVFNDETNEFFAAPIPSSITSSDSMISYPNMINGKLNLITNTEIYPDLKSENGPASSFGSYFFRNDNQPIDRNLSGIAITDDTEMMKEMGEYTYILNTSLINVASPSSLPYLSIKNTTGEGYLKDNLCVFNTPQTSYSSEVYSGKSIYYNFWKNYLDERYSNKIKKVTCYINLSPTDYFNFNFNQFVTIENQLYFVNKIYDYDVERQISTKVDLLTIQDARNFYFDNFNDTILELNKSRIIISSDGYTTLEVTTNRVIKNIECPFEYTIKLYEDLDNAQVYKLTFKNSNMAGVYNIHIDVDEASVDCEVVVTNWKEVYFEYSPTSVEFVADGEEHSTYLTISTNTNYTYRASSNKVEILQTPYDRLRIVGKSTIPTVETVTFTAGGVEYPFTITFTGSEFYVLPDVLDIAISTGTAQTDTFKIVSSHSWEIIGDIPSTVLIGKMTGTGTTTVQVTSTCDYATVIPLTIREMETGNEIPFTINIGDSEYIIVHPKEFNYPADGNLYEGIITIDTNVNYYVTGDLIEDETTIELQRLDDGIKLLCSSNEAVTKSLCILTTLGEEIITINFI